MEAHWRCRDRGRCREGSSLSPLQSLGGEGEKPGRKEATEENERGIEGGFGWDDRSLIAHWQG